MSVNSTILHDKYQSLCHLLKNYGSVAVAFSGGVDSTFLLRVASDVLGKNVIAVSVKSLLIPEAESRYAEEFCSQNGIRYIGIDFDAVALTQIRQNHADRCYHCKKAMFERIIGATSVNDITYVCDGSNIDDVNDYRPGMRALAELGVRSPLKECNINKEEIRILSKKLGLPTWDKPSAACLASRIPYNEEVSERKLMMINKSETLLTNLGIRNNRVRMHGLNIARIEVAPDDMETLILNREKVINELKELGFVYVCMDMDGYRTGSMNKSLDTKQRVLGQQP